MEREQLMTELRKKEDSKVYAELGYRDDSVIPLLIEIMETEKTAVKYQAEKAVRKISEERPAMLLPYGDRLIGLLDSENNFIKWGMLLTLPGLLVSPLVPVAAGCGIRQCGLVCREASEGLSGRGNDDHSPSFEYRRSYVSPSRCAVSGMPECSKGTYSGMLSGTIPRFCL